MRVKFQALEELAAFKSGDEAYALRGKIEGINIVVKLIENLITYEEHDGRRTDSGTGRDKYDAATGF